jgi:hypothetical protein
MLLYQMKVSVKYYDMNYLLTMRLFFMFTNNETHVILLSTAMSQEESLILFMDLATTIKYKLQDK